MPTTIKLKNSVTTTSVPSSLVQGEVAINITDKKVWVGNAATTPIQIAGAGTTGNAAGSNTQVQYNSSGSFAGSANFTFNGTTVTMANDASISGLTVGKGGGSSDTNTVVGAASALAANTSGTYNNAFGRGALQLNTTGALNSAFGWTALLNNTTGSNNTAIGNAALIANTTASNNTAVGFQAAYSNTTGTIITAIGRQALYNNTTGTDNTALGYAMVSNTTGSYNTGIGLGALQLNTTASNNTAVGYQAGYSNTTGADLTAVGYLAGYSNTTGTSNLFLGRRAGYSNTTSGNNTYVGEASGNQTTGNANTFVGNAAGNAITTGSKNTILGTYSGNQGGLDIRTASNYIVLSDGDGNPRMSFNSTGKPVIYNMDAGAGTNALRYSTSTGAITYDTSSARYKDNIRDSKYGLADVMQMRSAQFEYKDDGRSDVGLIAEELQPIIPELVGTDKEGRADSVSYDRIVSVLVKAIQELKQEVDSLKAQLNK
jgi:hypothetical protein